MKAKKVKIQGIEDVSKLLDLIALGATAKVAYEAIKQDGRVNIFDIAQLLPLIAPVEDLIKGRQLLISQFSDIDDQERELLKQRFGQVVEDPKYQMIFDGILQISQGAFKIAGALKKVES